MKKGFLLSTLLLVGCASTQTAKQFRYISYEDKPSAQKSIGTIEGKDCSWSVLGYSMGQPNVRSAFTNAAERKKEGFIPGQSGSATGPQLKAIHNVTVENDGFSLWVVGRSCVVVTGEGYL